MSIPSETYTTIITPRPPLEARLAFLHWLSSNGVEEADITEAVQVVTINSSDGLRRSYKLLTTTVNSLKRPSAPMNLADARALLITEGALDALVLSVRMGEDPGHARLARIALALELLSAQPPAGAAIDKELMRALWLIGHESYVQSLGWQEQKGAWRNDQYLHDMMRIWEGIEALLEF